MKSNLLSWNSPIALEMAADQLIAQKAIVGTTDTVLGLLTQATAEGHRTLDALKGRNDKPYLILIDSLKTAAQLAYLPEQGCAARIIDQYWPGPLTIILRARPGIDVALCSKTGTIALRVPNHAGLQELIRRVGPLFSTSANKAGAPVPDRIDTIDPDIMNAGAFILTDEQATQSVASTIIDVSAGSVTLVRAGTIVQTDFEKICGYSIKKA